MEQVDQVRDNEIDLCLPLTSTRSFQVQDQVDMGMDRLVHYGHVLVLSGIQSVWATCNTRALLYRLNGSGSQNSVSRYEFQQPITTHVQMPEDGALGRVGSGFVTGAVAVYRLTCTDPGPVQIRWLNVHGKISSSSVTCLTWTPTRPYHLYVAHAHCAIVVYDLRLDQECPIRILNTETGTEPRPSIRQRFMSRRDMRKTSAVSEVETPEFRILMRRPDSGRNPVQCLASSPDALNLAQFAPEGHLLAIAQNSGSVVVLDLESGPTPCTLSMFRTRFGAVLCLSWNPVSATGRRLLATGSQDDHVAVYDVYRGQCLAQCQAHTSWPTSLAFLSQPDADLLISVGEDRRAIIWRLSEWARRCSKDKGGIMMEPRCSAMEVVAEVQIDTEPIAALSVGDSDQGPVMSTISRFGRLKIWQLVSH